MVHESDAVKAFIVRILGTVPEGMLGAQLMDRIMAQFKEFQLSSYGARSLRGFLDSFVPDVRITGRSGMDNIYALTTTGGDVTSAEPVPGISRNVSELQVTATPPSSIWKTFASPSTPYKLFANKQTGALEVRKPGDTSPGSEWILVPSMPSEEHLKLAHEYLVHVESDLRARLESVLEKPRWWEPFYAVLVSSNRATDWNDQRRRHIISALKRALDERGIPSDSVDLQLRAQIVGTRTQTLNSSNSRRVPFEPPPERKARVELRQLASALVSGMSGGELRALRVRLGDVFDALER